MNSFELYIQKEKASGLFGFLKRKPEKEKIGEIVFHSDKIILAGKELFLSDLQRISIPDFNDYTGRNDMSKLSAGNDNKVELHWPDGKKETYYIVLEKRYQLRDINEQLISYHKAGKFDFDNLVAIFGLENYNAIQNFKNTLSIKSY